MTITLLDNFLTVMIYVDRKRLRNDKFRPSDYDINTVIKDPVLTSRHCACVFVLVFTRARQPLFLRSRASKALSSIAAFVV